jgi:GNAT superfamily N-acetyltransferase
VVIDGNPPPAAELIEVADAALGHLAHRRITLLDDAAGAALAPALVAAGYVHEPELVMSAGDAGERPAARDGGHVAQPVELTELRPAVMRQLRTWMPDADETVIEHLADRRAARRNGAAQVSFLGVRDEHGAVGAWADVYADPDQSIGQVEDVVTADACTRRGFGDALLSTARRLTADCELFFLLADPEDWPRLWYARRGFTPIGRIHVFSRTIFPRGDTDR